MIILLYMFYALKLVCDHYFVPTLEAIIKKQGISDIGTYVAAGGVFIVGSTAITIDSVEDAVFKAAGGVVAVFVSAAALKLTTWPPIQDTTFYSISLNLS